MSRKIISYSVYQYGATDDTFTVGQRADEGFGKMVKHIQGAGPHGDSTCVVFDDGTTKEFSENIPHIREYSDKEAD